MACWDTSPYTCSFDSGGAGSLPGGGNPDYSSLSTWESDTDNDLSGYGPTWLDCYDSQVHSDSGLNTGGASNTDATHYRGIRSASGCATPFAGKFGTGANFATSFYTSENFFRYYNFCIDVEIYSASSAVAGIQVYGNQGSIIANIVVSSINTYAGQTSYGIWCRYGATGQTVIINCIISDCDSHGFAYTKITGTPIVLILSCTAINNAAYGFQGANANVVAFSCYGADNASGDFIDTAANWHALSGWNASKDNTSDLGGTAGDNYKNGLDLTDTELDADYLPTQTNYAAGGAGDNYGRNFYDDVSATYDGYDFLKNDTSGDAISKKDIRGVDRPTPDTADVSWTVGAGEYTAGSPALSKATDPDPADDATDVAIDKTLGWTAGDGEPDSFDVYFASGATPTFIGNQVAATYDPGELENDTEYFWRIDSVKAGEDTVTGDEWSFTTVAAEESGANSLRLNMTIIV